MPCNMQLEGIIKNALCCYIIGFALARSRVDMSETACRSTGLASPDIQSYDMPYMARAKRYVGQPVLQDRLAQIIRSRILYLR